MLPDLVKRGDSLMRKLERIRTVGLKNIPEPERLKNDELLAWYRAAEALIELEFGPSSDEARRWRETLTYFNDLAEKEILAGDRRYDSVASEIRTLDASIALLRHSSERAGVIANQDDQSALPPVISELIRSVDYEKVLPYAMDTFDEEWIESHLPGNLTPNDIKEFRGWLNAVPEEKKKNAVFMDTTTLATAFSLIDKDFRVILLTPVNLFDLSTFVTSTVIYDHICHFENTGFDAPGMNRAIGDSVFVPIPRPVASKTGLEGAAAVMRDLWDETVAYIDDLKSSMYRGGLLHQELDALRKGWTLVAGRELKIGELFDEKELERWDSNGPFLVKQLTQALGKMDESFAFIPSIGSLDYGWTEFPLLSQVVSECNHRSYFNQRLSSILGLPYAPNTTRLPLRNFHYQRARMIQEGLATVKLLEHEYARLADTYSAPQDGNLRLPVFLSAILAKVSRRGEFFEELGALRKKAESFRAHRKELDEQVAQGNLVALKKIRAAMEVDAQTLSGFLSYAPVMSALGATLAAAAHAPISYVGAALAIIVAGAKAVPDATRTRLIRRLLKPQLWFMTDMTESAAALSNAMPKLNQLWGIDERVQDAFAQRLKNLAALRY